MLKIAKCYFESDEEKLRKLAQKINTELSEERKIQRKNMEKTDMLKCLKKKYKNYKNVKELFWG